MQNGKPGRMIFEETFKGKKVFLTGHTGFKGSWLTAWLHLLGAHIKGYSLAPENTNDLYHAINGDVLNQSVIGDIRDAEKLKGEILAFKPDFIFHLAAQPLVRLSYEIPTSTFEINAQGSANLLDAVRFLNNKCIVVMITTDKVYHNIEQHYPYKEDDRLGGYDPYSASKAAAEIIIDSYRKSYFNPAYYNDHGKSISVARAGNVIGGGDWAKDRIIPDIIKALSHGKKIQVRNPLAIRPWQHVLEPLSGYLTLAAKQAVDPVAYTGAYNFGPYITDNLTVKELVEKAINYWGAGEAETYKQEKAVHEAGLLQLDISKAGKELNWHPIWDAGNAIEKTISWYRNLEDNNALKLVEKDIEDYQNTL